MASTRCQPRNGKPKGPGVGPKLSKEEREALFAAGKCFICKKEGHKSAQCPEKKTAKQSN